MPGKAIPSGSDFSLFLERFKYELHCVRSLSARKAMVIGGSAAKEANSPNLMLDPAAENEDAVLGDGTNEEVAAGGLGAYTRSTSDEEEEEMEEDPAVRGEDDDDNVVLCEELLCLHHLDRLIILHNYLIIYASVSARHQCECPSAMIRNHVVPEGRESFLACAQVA